MGDGLEDSDSCVELKIGAIHHLLVAGKRHHTASYLHIVGTQLRELLRQDGLQAHECLGNEFKFFHYLVTIFYVESHLPQPNEDTVPPLTFLRRIRIGRDFGRCMDGAL